MNVVTPESASSSETLFGGEKDYAAMYDMICAHSVAQIVRCAALFSFRPSGRGPGHRGRGRACRGPECGRHLSSDAGLCRLWADEIRQGAGLLGDAAPGDPAHGRSSLFVRYGHGPGRPWPLGLFPSCSGRDAPASGWNCRAYSTGENMGCSGRWRSCARSDTLVLDACVCCVSSSRSSTRRRCDCIAA